MQAEEPAVTAVVLNWCAERDTRACIESLRRSSYPNLRILLVDNGSPDGSGERLHRELPDVEYLQTGSNRGFTGGNNRGMEHALAGGADYLLLLNNDTVAEPECVGELVCAAQEHPAVGAVAPKILRMDDPRTLWFAGGELSLVRALGRHRGEGATDRRPRDRTTEEVSFLTGCCLLLPAPVVRRAGGFEEDFFAYVEDVELSLRLRSLGYALVYAPAARLLHRVPPRGQTPTPSKIFYRDRNRRRLARRHYSPLRRFAFNFFFYPSRLLRAAQYLGRGDRARLRALWRGMTAS